MRGAIIRGVLALAALAAVGASGGPPTVELFTPTGTVEAAEQVRVRFSDAMIAFGDPRAPAPVDAACAAGIGRWVDAREWAYDFADPLPGGLRCRFTLKPGLRTLGGAAVTGTRAFAFDTGGPSIVGQAPQGERRAAEDDADGDGDTYGSIEEDQTFLLALNADATPESIAAHARCTIEGVGEAIPLDPVSDAERKTLLNGAARAEWGWRGVLERSGWVKPQYQEPDAKPVAKRALFVGRCRRALPAGGRVSVVWGAGIASPSGLVTTVATRIDYKVRPAFSARFQCSRVNPAAACSPVEAMTLAFSSPVPVETAMAVRLVGADGKAVAPTPPEKGRGSRERLLRKVQFAGPFPERAEYRVVLPAALADASGRALQNAARFPLSVRTDEAPPLVKFAGTFGIVEANEGGVLPVTLRNVENPLGGKVNAVAGRALRVDGADGTVADWVRQLDKAEEETSIEEPIAGTKDKTRRITTTRNTPLIAPGDAATGLSVPKPGGAHAFEVVGIPLGKPGFYVVELASPKLGAALLGHGGTRYVATGALVTDLSVHFAWGHGRSLAWVTRLHDATPVAGADVVVSDSCSGEALWKGRTDAQGRAAVIADLPEVSTYGSCEHGLSHPLMVSARAGDDFSFALTSWNKGIQSGDFSLPRGYGFPKTAAVTVFDRTLIRGGETIHMKHLIRARTDAGLERPAVLTGKQTLTITHQGSDTKYEQDVVIGADGIGTSEWAAPKAAALGTYTVEIGSGADKQQTGSFQLDEFRLPTMRASVSGPKLPLVRPTSAPIDLSLGYFSGGAAGGAPVTLRTIVQPREVSPKDYEGFAFSGEKVVEGVTPANGEDEGEAKRPTRASVQPLGLDANGTARASAPVPAFEGPSELVAEMDYDDANGERRTQSAKIAVDPAALHVGVKTDGWMSKSDDVRLRMVALDLMDRPIKGQRVEIALYSRETYSYRKRIIGGFYSYDDSREVKKLSAACSETTDAQGYATCKLDAGVSGEVIAVATARDAQGNTARATTTLYLAGSDDWWFGGDNGDRMDLIPEKPEYAAGAVARFQVRMPFRRATALVSVLRDGVIDSFVTEISGRDPVVEVPLKHGYAPNVYVSVMAVRGRIAGWRLWLAELARKWDLPWISRDAAAPTALVDLAKPSYRLGIAKVRVGWEEHRLGVRVTPAAARYRIRQVADVGVQVTAPGGGNPPRDAEVAIAAVDEALLGLKPNESWDVLTAMMAARPLGVEFSTAQTQVVGKRHYGLKAVAAGGGGGASAAPPRSDFQPLLLWRGRVALDAQGRAAVKVPLNDALSAFRVVAVASAGADRFGTGEATIRTTQDLILLSGLPPLVRSGDSYDAPVTVRNTTEKPLRATVSARAGGVRLPPLTVALAPGEARQVQWSVRAPGDEGTVKWSFAAVADGASDKLDLMQQVATAVPVRTLQATLVQLDKPLSLPVALPVGAIPGKGGLEVALSAKLAGSMEGAKAFMREYAYDCFEQEASRAVVLGDRAMWDRLMASLPRYLDRDGLVRFFPFDRLEGDDTLTGYILTLSSETGWAIPDAPRANMIAGLKAVVTGGAAHSHADVLVVQKGRGIVGRGDFGGDLALRRIAAIGALARLGAADAAMLGTVDLTPDAWPTSTVAEWSMILDRVGGIPDAAAKRAQATAVLRARLDSQGTALSLTRPDAMWWLLGSGDTTAARVLLSVADRPEWAADAGRVARGLVVRRGRAGAWDTTVANAMATVALNRFSARFERVAVSGRTVAAVGGASRAFDWPAPAPALLPWPAGAAPLTLAHTGPGAPWATISARSAVPLARAYASGFAVRRIVTPVSQAHAGEWHRGDVMRVRIEVDTRADANWTVIDDPVPAGTTILGGGLGGRSTILDAAGAVGTNGPEPAYVERKQEAARAYFDWVPRGRIAYEYTLRLGTVGRFALPPTHVEALYVPGMIALLPNAAMVVLP